ncbi:MAG TPA: hypothetical protein VJA82_07850 [Sediminibacterium sp.]|uniref:hypothetical protein n=1 Tax=Sediminibacterium sp. TaxID=1917865 RepID=UPI0008D3DC13|nr:hypothetical protein [Sediminibacterium sp.]OHC84435.1 MAG: hypothetical protein A2472_10690 [Sphingobacteriia bacterium RIFOXYC2_FULL_35_18]OHC88070.1 MAG: hypothetical protein A2546_00235 [Sphingobacteriia bacterium RIFOXYD2_FULL_35_12]HLD53200.1 hypothetical protein [Sediminibacterium sp.]
MKKILFSVLVVFAAIASLSAQTADDVINKYVAAIGGAEKWSKIQSLKVEGQIEVQGLAIPFTMQAVHMKGMRVDAEFQGNVIIDITTPTKGWSQNPLMGKSSLEAITADELKSKLDELDVQDEFVNYKEKGSTVEFLGKEEEEGTSYNKVKLTTKNGNEKTYYFDLTTNLIYKEETTIKQQGQEMKQAVKYLDYKTLENGIKMAFKTDMGMMMMVTNKVTINPTIDEAIFSGN